MSESVRLKEIRVRQEIYKELLRQTKASSNETDANGGDTSSLQLQKAENS